MHLNEEIKANESRLLKQDVLGFTGKVMGGRATQTKLYE